MEHENRVLQAKLLNALERAISVPVMLGLTASITYARQKALGNSYR